MSRQKDSDQIDTGADNAQNTQNQGSKAAL